MIEIQNIKIKNQKGGCFEKISHAKKDNSREDEKSSEVKQKFDKNEEKIFARHLNLLSEKYEALVHQSNGAYDANIFNATNKIAEEIIKYISKK